MTRLSDLPAELHTRIAVRVVYVCLWREGYCRSSELYTEVVSLSETSIYRRSVVLIALDQCQSTISPHIGDHLAFCRHYLPLPDYVGNQDCPWTLMMHRLKILEALLLKQRATVRRGVELLKHSTICTSIRDARTIDDV